MAEIVKFLTARLDERERYARQALDSPDSATTGTGVRIVDGELAIMPSAMSMGLTLHFVNHSPARVLAEVAAKRRILARHWDRLGCPVCLVEMNQEEDVDGNGHAYPVMHWTEPCETVRDLAAPYADHPDYRPEWSLV